ncbi:MAG TPA: hypothetical protein VHY56_03300, partial [Candidatus Binataceae bacterium]|nr:hypothetical protein [Candidatus Binataceae bacterium]
ILSRTIAAICTRNCQLLQSLPTLQAENAYKKLHCTAVQAYAAVSFHKPVVRKTHRLSSSYYFSM